MVANLKDTIKTNSGIFQDSSAASDAYGRAANPTNPLAASTLGLNADQAKMAGSSANKSSAFRDLAADASTPAGSTSLRDAIRKDQVDGSMSQEEKDRKASAAKVGTFTGKLEDRVQALSAQYAKGIAPTLTVPKVDASTIAAAGLVPADGSSPDSLAASINALLAPLPTDPTQAANAALARTEAGNSVAKALGLDPADPNLLATLQTKMGQLMPEADDEVAQSVAGAIEDYDKVTLDTLFKGDPQGASGTLGSLADLATATGMSADPQASNYVGNLNIPGLKAELEKIGIKDFSYIKDLQRKAADPFTSEAERTAVLRELKSLGASGVRATEADYNKLNDAVKQGQMVTIGGQSMSLEAALSDDRISAQVSNYLKMTPEQKAEFEASNPDLAKLINGNRSVLTEASKRLDDSIEASADAVLAQRATIGGVQLSDGAMKALMPDFGKYGGTIPPESKAFLDKVKDLPQATAQFLNDQLTSGGITAKDIATLGNLDPQTLGTFAANPQQLRGWLDFNSSLSSVVETDPARTLGIDGGSMNRTLKDFWATIRTNYTGSPEQTAAIAAMEALDANRDGIYDGSSQSLAERLKGLSSQQLNSGLPDGKFTNPLEQVRAGIGATIKQGQEKQAADSARVAAEELAKSNERKATLDKQFSESSAGLEDLLNRKGGEGNGGVRATMDREFKAEYLRIRDVLRERKVDTQAIERLLQEGENSPHAAARGMPIEIQQRIMKLMRGEKLESTPTSSSRAPSAKPNSSGRNVKQETR